MYHNYHSFWNDLSKIASTDRLMKGMLNTVDDFEDMIKLLGKEKVKILRL